MSAFRHVYYVMKFTFKLDNNLGMDRPHLAAGGLFRVSQESFSREVTFKADPKNIHTPF